MYERREHVRLNIPVLIEFPNPETWETERSYTQDISAAGFRFPTSVRLTIGQELALTLQLPYQEAGFQTTGEIVWIREVARIGGSHYEVGVRLRWVQDIDRQRLVHHLSSFWPS